MGEAGHIYRIRSERQNKSPGPGQSKKTILRAGQDIVIQLGKWALQQVCLAQGRAKGQIEDSGTDDGHNCVDQSGGCRDFCQGCGELGWNLQQVGFVEVAYDGVCKHVEEHAAR